MQKAGDAPLEVIFFDGGEVILRNFIVGQDEGEAGHHCTAIIVDASSRDTTMEMGYSSS
jgi:hypothetical protein